MFLSQRMKKIDLVIVKKYAEAVSKEIVKFGDFQTIEIDAAKVKQYTLTKTSADESASKLVELDRRTNFLSSVVEPVFLRLEEHQKEEKNGFELLEEYDLEKNIRNIEGELTKYNQEMEELKRRQSDISIKIRRTNFFAGFNLDLAPLKDLSYFMIGFGIVPKTSMEGFTSALSTLPSLVKKIDEIGSDILLFFAAPKTMKEKVDSILKNVYFRDYGLPHDVEKGAMNAIFRYAFDLSFTHDEEIWLEKKYRQFILKTQTALTNLKKNIQYYLSIAKLKGEMAGSGSAYLFSGWVPAASAEKLKKEVERISENKCVFLEKSATEAMEKEGLTPPTKFSNPKILRPFESLVSMFGFPNYRELDPTPIAALAYVIMYGAMFGDIGQGAVLAVLGFTATRIKKLRSMKSLGYVMFYVGLSSILFGVLYGSIFGREDIFHAMWMEPMKNIMPILLISIAFGVGMITLAIVLSMVNSLMEKNWGRLLFSPNGLAGLALYWSGLYIVYFWMSKLPFSPWVWLIVALAVLLIAFEKNLEMLFHKGEHHEKPNMIIGIVEVFEACISFLSNSMSFMRVGAFALNHAALMGVVFILADSPNPVVHWIALLIGNIFVIVLEGLIVGIQALRLEFYEFFVKFFRADGRAFEGLDIYKNV